METLVTPTESWCRLSLGREPLGRLSVPDALADSPEYQRIHSLTSLDEQPKGACADGAGMNAAADATLARACAKLAARLDSRGLRRQGLPWWRAAADRGDPQAVLTLSEALYSRWVEHGCESQKLEVRLARELLRTAAAEYANPKSAFSSEQDRQAQVRCGVRAIHFAHAAHLPADYCQRLEAEMWQQRAKDRGIAVSCAGFDPERSLDSELLWTVRVVKHIEPSDESALQALIQRYERLRSPLPLVELPDLERVRSGMKARFPYWKTIIDLIMPLLAFRLMGASPFIRMPPLLLVGVPGIGKNQLARALGELLSLPARTIPLGGSSDNRALQGTARGWSSAKPSSVLEAILQVEVANPLIILDEVDKVGNGRHNGNVLDTLHYLLEPSTAREWFDECLCGECDLSHINWIATANRWKHLPDSLLSRFRVIEMPAPAPKYGNALINLVLAAFARELRIAPSALPPLTDLDRQRVLAGAPNVRTLKGRLELVLGEKALRASKSARPSRPRRRGVAGAAPSEAVS